MKKDIVLIIAVIAVVILTIVSFRFIEKGNKAVKALEEERFSRMVAEETIQKNAAKISTLEAQLKSANDKMAKIQDLVDQQKDVNSDLKRQYEELEKTKAALESQLTQAINEPEVVEIPVPVAEPVKAE